MSFGFGVGDFIAVGKLAWSTYKSCKEAPESFNNISVEVLSLHPLLKEVEEAILEEPLSDSKQRSLAAITNGCQCVLQDLQALVLRYEGLGSQSRSTRDRLQWGSSDISELRARITSNTVILTAFMSTSQVVVERKLNKIIRECQEGNHEWSVETVTTVESLTSDDKKTWRAIRKELQDIGISVVAFDANRPFIMSWLQNAIQNGPFEGKAPGADGIPENLDEASLPSTAIPFPEMVETGLHPAHRNRNSMAHPNLQSGSPLPTSKSPTRLGISDQQQESTGSPPDVYITPSIPWKHPPRIVSLITRLFSNKHEALVDACRVGNLSTAQESIERGADINTLRFSSTPLGFASRRGDVVLASWLLDHGADINLVDKDGHSPLDYCLRGCPVKTLNLAGCCWKRVQICLTLPNSFR